MSRIVVFGAGGRAGRQAVAEARGRGHQVTAVVRDDPARHTAGPADDGLRFAAGDVTDGDFVAALAAGHDAAIHTAAVYGEGTDPDAFFTAAARALVAGLRQAGVPRLVAAGLSVLLPGPDGSRMLDAPGFPAQFRPFCLAHAAGLDVLRAEAGELDWVYVSPAGDFDHEAGGTEPPARATRADRTGRPDRYAIRTVGDTEARISYADFAAALVDEADAPRHHRLHLAVT